MVRRMIDYFYTLDYADGERPKSFPEKGPYLPRIHATMFALANMYQVDGLQSLAASKFAKALKEGGTLSVRFSNVIVSIPDVYELTPCSVRTLLDMAVEGFRAFHAEIVRGARRDAVPPAGAGVPVDIVMRQISDLVGRTPDFVKDILSSYLKDPFRQPEGGLIGGKCLSCAVEDEVMLGI